MAQVKKAEVRSAILTGAARLFTDRGYATTTIAQIAQEANVSSANVYVYFNSKLEILYAIYDPWMRTRLERLEKELEVLEGANTKIRHLLATFWRDIPGEQNGFAVNVMQAIAAYEQGQGYRPTLLVWLEARIDRMIGDALSDKRSRASGDAPLAHLIVMAFDGFVLNRRVEPARICDDTMLDLVTRWIADRDG